MNQDCTRYWYEPPCVIVIINFATYTRQWFIFKIHFKNLRILMIRNNCFHFDCIRTLTSYFIDINGPFVFCFPSCVLLLYSFDICQTNKFFMRSWILMESSISQGINLMMASSTMAFGLTYNSSKNTQTQFLEQDQYLIALQHQIVPLLKLSMHLRQARKQYR